MARRITHIVIHCSATDPRFNIGVAEIRDWHVHTNGWDDIGYHYVIRRDGYIEEGRPESAIGAHVRGFNRNSLGICLVGGVRGPEGVPGTAPWEGEPDCNYTKAQWAALEELVKELVWRHKNAEVLGHRDFPGVNKACPCFDVGEWWNGQASGS